MGAPGAKSNSQQSNSTSGFRSKTLKLTVIFAPCSRSELLDIYNPIEFPNIDRQMRVISRQLTASGAYSDEPQDKVVYINCASIQCTVPEGGEPVPDSVSMLDKLERAIQLIHELLDANHGYGGTVQTNFCSYQPLEDIMFALQSILGCSGGSVKDAEFGGNASFLYSNSFARYKDWTFVNKHTSTYKAIYEYQSSNGKSEAENLKDENERLIDSIEDEEARRKFREWYDAESGSMTKTTKRYGVEGLAQYHPEYQKYLNAIDKNNRRLGEINQENQKFAEEWGKKSKGQRIGYVDKQLNQKYDTNAVKQKYQPHLDELKAKMRQLDYQQGKTQDYAWHTDDMDRARAAYTIGAKRHENEYVDGYHSRDTIEYNGEYYTRGELAEMYNGMKAKMNGTINKMNADKKAERSKAMDDIHKQIYKETLYAGLTIVNIVAIVFAPLALVDILVISYELAWTDKKFDFSTFMAIALDLFALVPFIGAIAKAGGIGSKLLYAGKYTGSRLKNIGNPNAKQIAQEVATEAADKFTEKVNKITMAVSDNIVNDLTQQGVRVATKGAAGSVDNIADGLIKNAENLGLSEISDINVKIATETAIGDALKGEASKITKNYYNAAGKGNTISYATQIENDLTKVGEITTKGEAHLATVDSLKGTRQTVAVNMIDGHLQEVNQVLAGNVSSVGGGLGEVAGGLPVISLKGYYSDVKMFIQNASNMSKEARISVIENLTVQTMGHVGAVKGAYDSAKSLSSDPSYTAQELGEDFILIVKN